MWKINSLEIKPAILDFSSSEQGKREVSRLLSDGIELINAIELVDWDSEDTQVLICEECGYVHCEPGGWVSFRRSDSLDGPGMGPYGPTSLFFRYSQLISNF